MVNSQIMSLSSAPALPHSRVEVTGPSKVDSTPIDALEFSRLTAPPASQPAPTVNVSAPTATTGHAATQPIVEGIHSASQHLRTRLGTIRELTSKANFTGGAADLLRMQLEMVQLGFEIELTGKVVTRATQDIDQLSKLQ